MSANDAHTPARTAKANDARSTAPEALYRLAATMAGASIMGIRQINLARSELLERHPTAGRVVDDAIVVSLIGVGPTSRLAERSWEQVAAISPEPIAEASRQIGRAAGSIGRLVRLTGLDQPAPKRSPRRS